jgi:hypothetical protein
LIRLLDRVVEIAQTVQRIPAQLGADFLDRQLRRFRPARQTADSVGHAEEHRVFIEEKTIFVFPTNPTDVRERGGAKQWHGKDEKATDALAQAKG